MHEGETAFLQLINAIGTDQDFSTIPNLIYKDSSGIHTSTVTSSEDMSTLPPPDFDGLPLDKYFVPDKILSYLSTEDAIGVNVHSVIMEKVTQQGIDPRA